MIINHDVLNNAISNEYKIKEICRQTVIEMLPIIFENYKSDIAVKVNIEDIKKQIINSLK